jgi:regulator of protease activity HflC (stomatin/prohibitin superfamily)
VLFLGVLVGCGLYLAFLATRSSFRVEEGHIGIVTSFGAAEFEGESKTLREYGPGLHFKWPWQKTRTVSMKEQSLELSGERGGEQAMAHDGTILRFDSTLRYVPERAHLAHFLFGMKNPQEHITGLFSCLLRNEIANFEGSPEAANKLVTSGNDAASAAGALGSVAIVARDFPREAGSYAQIRSERALLNARIEDFCKNQIGSRYGVRFNAVDLIDILPPDELAEALNAVMQARTEAERAYFDAEGACQKRLLAAREGVSIATVRASAVKTEIEKLGEFLLTLEQQGMLEAYVKRRSAEAYSEARTLIVKETAR